MLPSGTTFQAALLELGQVERTPYSISLDNSANTSYATSSISGPEESPIIAPTTYAGAVAPLDAQNGKGDRAVEGLPNAGSKGVEGLEEGCVEVIVAFEKADGEQMGVYEGLAVPAISHRDAQRIRDILLGKVKAPNHVSAGVGVGGGFLSLAPEWQK